VYNCEVVDYCSVVRYWSAQQQTYDVELADVCFYLDVSGLVAGVTFLMPPTHADSADTHADR
jgi:hypothetical protein